MNFNFELILFWAVVISGIISLFDILFLAPKRKKAYQAALKTNPNLAPPKFPMIIDYARSFFPVLLLVFGLRSFLYELFRIPSGSLEPTLLIGDFILVNKYDYGIRLPVAHKKIYSINEPKHGDIIVFRYPLDPSKYYIKRLIGLPGDHISYINKVLFVNGQKMAQTFVKKAQEVDEDGNTRDVLENEEDFFGVKHEIYLNPNRMDDDFKDVIVPPGMYFAMGDNRDDSGDSRIWGFVPDKNLVGHAEWVLLSVDWTHYKVRWNRTWERVH